MSRVRLGITALATALGAILVAGMLPAGAHAQTPSGVRVDLRVLVVDDGGPGSAAIADRLGAEGVPYTRISLDDPNRPTIDAAYLAGTTADGVPEAKFQAVVLPNDNPFGDGPEQTALSDYERQYGVRQVDAYTWPNPTVGLNYPDYSGTLDGTTATVTDAGLAGPFDYLRGPVPFEDNDPAVQESYGFLAQPMAGFTPFVTGTAPGGATTGVLAGQYDADGRSQLVLTFAYNADQHQYALLAHGIITWMTQGVHLGYDRNYFSVDVDDVFLADSRWSTTGNCTPGEDCTGGQTTADIRMGPDDVSTAVAWEQASNFTLDLMFNGDGSVEAEADAPDGQDPLSNALLAAKDAFRWTNHTYSHQFLGCVQDFTVVPWRCATDPVTGAIRYEPQSLIESEINQNISWASAHGIPLDPTELVTGEHSGMALLPQQPDDNPALAPAVATTGVDWLGADASRSLAQRAVGNALTIPRYPLNVFYNVSTVDEEVDEYNWIYDSRADGGSGLCQDHPDIMTCVAPLTSDSGYASYIVPGETAIAMTHILDNDPRPHFVHQSNLTGDRLLYPLLDNILSTYRAQFADSAPVLSQRLSADGLILRRQQEWNAALSDGSVAGFLQDGVVTVTAPAGLSVPLTAPEGTLSGGDPFGAAYAGERSGYLTSDGVSPVVLSLPGGA